MKTKRARFRCEVPSARCQGDDRVWVAEPVGVACRERCENEGSSGDVDEKEGRVFKQVSGREYGAASVSVPAGRTASPSFACVSD